ncbi:MAG: 5-formyltetrahydrofolate cyclo-ligase [Candidatus Firestonebacteria bacterium]|nr:5-formyltetrahydrofolate cyclo-ligase [Candidatus Firestonebacteria bacterium]
MPDKAAWRKQLLTARKNFPSEQRLAADREITRLLLALPEWQAARTVGCYLSLPDEVTTRAFFQAGLAGGKIMAAPVITRPTEPMHFYQLTSDQNLIPGPLGILQPPADRLVPPQAFDLFIVPGVGFDLQGYRLGYGGGFYDRYLTDFSALTLGLAYAFQVVERFPTASHDCPVQMMISEKGVYDFRRPGLG